MQYVSLRKRNDDRVVHMEIAEFFTLRGGRILIHRSFFNSFDFLQQLLGQDLTGAYAHQRARGDAMKASAVLHLSSVIPGWPIIGPSFRDRAKHY